MVGHKRWSSKSSSALTPQLWSWLPFIHHWSSKNGAPGYQKEAVYTNTGAQVDTENAPRVFHLAGICSGNVLASKPPCHNDLSKFRLSSIFEVKSKLYAGSLFISKYKPFFSPDLTMSYRSSWCVGWFELFFLLFRELDIDSTLESFNPPCVNRGKK